MEAVRPVSILAKQELEVLMVPAHDNRPEVDDLLAADRKVRVGVEERHSLAEVGSLVGVEGIPAVAAEDSLAVVKDSLVGHKVAVGDNLLAEHYSVEEEAAGRMERVGEEEHRSHEAAGRMGVVDDS